MREPPHQRNPPSVVRGAEGNDTIGGDETLTFREGRQEPWHIRDGAVARLFFGFFPFLPCGLPTPRPWASRLFPVDTSPSTSTPVLSRARLRGAPPSWRGCQRVTVPFALRVPSSPGLLPSSIPPPRSAGREHLPRFGCFRPWPPTTPCAPECFFTASSPPRPPPPGSADVVPGGRRIFSLAPCGIFFSSLF